MTGSGILATRMSGSKFISSEPTESSCIDRADGQLTQKKRWKLAGQSAHYGMANKETDLKTRWKMKTNSWRYSLLSTHACPLTHTNTAHIFTCAHIVHICAYHTHSDKNNRYWRLTLLLSEVHDEESRLCKDLKTLLWWWSRHVDSLWSCGKPRVCPRSKFHLWLIPKN